MAGEMSKEVVSTCIGALKRIEQKGENKREEDALRQLTEWLSKMKFEDGKSVGEDNPKLDPLAGEYLLQFWDSFSLRNIEVIRGKNWTEAGSESMHARRHSSLSGDSGSLLLPAELAKLQSWEDFDVFKVETLTNGKPLETVAMAILEEFELVTKLNLDTAKLTKFFKAVEEHYLDNPYHNKTHAADVVQALGVILARDNLKSRFTDLELLAMLLAAVVHDVAHPGVTNEFHINTRSPVAIMYNDVSVNENFHASKAFKLMQGNDYHALDGLSEDDFRFVRKSMIRMVLATDMIKHNELLARFSRFFTLYDKDLDKWESDDARSALRQMLLHCADISNPARPWKLASQWSHRIMEELFAQGDKEASLGVACSPLCRRDHVQIPKSQATFLEFVAKPSLELLSQLAPKFGETALHHVAVNLAEWEARMKEDGAKPTGAARPSPDLKGTGLNRASQR
ncbi:unnamed protein product [Ostreobium quekettii]|uniref:Phosphodiesterase n=1 Tax=Ostreobium quekettii TaxID=121088 RepID=A0A8S1J9Y4_9CHLO|nr:unnamed protein product [Ostreobium quekettii]|eukprot:evm.model.scf_2688.1 EVM.evm.TU.scf_2688.1   scf_2688:10178-15637(-)